jgi:hypothetical protein
MTTRLEDLRVTRVAMVDRGADQDAHMVLFKRLEGKEASSEVPPTQDGGKPGVSKGDENMPDLNLEALPEDLRKHFGDSGLSQEGVDALAATLKATEDAAAKQKTEMAALTTKVDEMRKALDDKSDDEGTDPVLKGLSPEAAAAVEKMRKDSEEMRKALDAEVEKNAIREHVEVAKHDYGKIPGADPTEIGPLLYRMEKGTMTAEDRTKFSELLKAAQEISSENTLLKQELGHTGHSVSADDDPVLGIAKRFQTADPTLSDAVAYDKALQTDEGRRAYAAMAKDRSERLAPLD